MFCPNCGEKNPEGAIFCQECGGKMATGIKRRVEQSQMGQPKVAEQDLEVSKIEKPRVEQARTEMPRTERPKAEKAKMTTKKKIILAELVVLVVLLAGAYKIGEKRLGAEAVAVEYFKQVMNADWASVYDKLELEENEFLSKELFVEGNKVIGSEEYTTFEIEKEGMLANSNSVTKRVNIIYHLKGDMNEGAMYINLVKQPEKKLFFFDDWKVLPNEYIIEQYPLEVPKGVTVKLANIELGEQYKTNSSDGRDYYTIPKVFSGRYTIQLTQENMEDVIMPMATVEDYYFDRMTIKKDVKKELVKKAGEDLRMFYTEGLAQADFSNMEKSFVKDEVIRVQLKNSFEEMKDDLLGENGSGVKSISFSNMGGVVYGEEDGSFRVELRSPYTTKYKSYSYWNGLEENSYSGETMNSFTYVFEDGKWLIKDFFIDVYY